MPSATAPVSQIALPLEPAGSDQVSRIVVGNANAEAVEALREPGRWPFHTAILTGPPRSGKTLLGRWAAAQGVDVIDDAEKVEEDALFHRWNASQQGGSRAGEPLLLITSAQPWTIALPDLRSRLGGSLHLELGEPDDAMAAQLIESLAAQRGLSLADGATDYLVPRTARSFADLERLVRMIDQISLERAAPATMSVWRAALEAVQGPEQANLL
ncbi:MAG: ATPase [Erythrobacter sp.]|uniref:HdaA/DnaA family protein n=1 Tax=Erythrobacter sp. TaxID=1042 RepID=UPI00262051DF|nr:ATPase [Erythrobacter sp.]MDJ0978781.1 ATPase [Erythrobacter sp.]